MSKIKIGVKRILEVIKDDFVSSGLNVEDYMNSIINYDKVEICDCDLVYNEDVLMNSLFDDLIEEVREENNLEDIYGEEFNKIFDEVILDEKLINEIKEYLK